MANLGHSVARTTRRVFGRNNYNRTLEAAVDPERQLEISRERRANLVPAEVLYSNNRRLQHIHLGIFMIRLHALHRRSAGTNALVVLRDTRWEDSRQIIATMEVDLSAGTQLVYTFPDMILSVNDFHNHVEVAIQTHGYDTWQGGESNLLITMALTGRLSNTSYMGFQYSVENVVDHLTTTGITAIPGERRSIEELEGMSWHLKPPEQTSVRVPSRVAVNERLNRSVLSSDLNDTDNASSTNCLNEARILEEEPLNKVKRYNKPKRSRQRSREKWSTLGEPSGKWDYYVKYDAPPDITPIEEIAGNWLVVTNTQTMMFTPGSSGVLPAIKFTHTFVSEMCKDAALAKELRDLSLCLPYQFLAFLYSCFLWVLFRPTGYSIAYDSKEEPIEEEPLEEPNEEG
ncbi:hypothetical protein Tco_0269771 [Tanacetum coccineum]